MALLDWQVDGSVAQVTLNDGENRFNPTFLDAFLEVLDRIEADTDARAVVVRSAHAKIFCNGIDLEWLVPHIQKGDIETCKRYFYQLNTLFKRLVTCPMLTVAAINGHAFAGARSWPAPSTFASCKPAADFSVFPRWTWEFPSCRG